MGFPLCYPLFSLSFKRFPTIIIGGSTAYLDNGIRALPRLSGAEEAQEEGAVR